MWIKSKDLIKDLYNSKYSNWIELDGLRSKWSLKQEVSNLCYGAVQRRQTYLKLKTEGSKK